MKVKDVIVVGAGIAGCAVALALAKRGVPVTLMTSSFDQRSYHAPFIQHELLEERVRKLQEGGQDQMGCAHASAQLAMLARRSIDELLESHYLVDRNGSIDIHRCLQEQLRQFTNVEWIANHSLIELLTLHKHSKKIGDIYKRPTCLGVAIYHHEVQKVERILAKEVILATGGASSLFPYSTHPSMVRGEGMAIASQAGARLLNMEQIQFHPIGLFEKDKPCFPLPLELLEEGGKLHAVHTLPPEDIQLHRELSYQIYEILLKNGVEHLWLDLTMLDAAKLKEKFPSIDAYCLSRGFNIAKDPLPVVPVARYTGGGIATERTGQSSLQRLRALGEVACTGLFYPFRDESINVLESLTWALTCAEDIAKHLSKFIYYFPEIKETAYAIEGGAGIIEEDWRLLRQIMWHYVGIKRDKQRLKRGCAMLEQLLAANAASEQPFSIDQIHLSNAIQSALLIARAARQAQAEVSADVLLNDPHFYQISTH
ncbi:FAD-dependent oxidoreductase [Candidatus Protochlamydia phocaeensis]|uniref:FAD-dependent oxidoreductase n=1 Tax=Candidatus Protochlamydia phocaeensis TaxID=1414722 RepID=UPI0008392C01|nr:FAD-dependent oxidoreductase [Candidatus Protochlamydia phocaeensis]